MNELLEAAGDYVVALEMQYLEELWGILEVARFFYSEYPCAESAAMVDAAQDEYKQEMFRLGLHDDYFGDIE